MLLLCKCVDYQGLRKVSILGHQDLLISSLQGHSREKLIACEKDSRRGVFTVCRSFLCALILFLSAQFLQSWSRETDGNAFFARRKKRMIIKQVCIYNKKRNVKNISVQQKRDTFFCMQSSTSFSKWYICSLSQFLHNSEKKSTAIWYCQQELLQNSKNVNTHTKKANDSGIVSK